MDMTRTQGLAMAGVIVLITLSFGASTASAAATPTFAEDVAPILYTHCVTCHREGEVAPMSLITYEETRPWSRSIKNKVLSGEMPPWHSDPDIGQFRNERRLSETEKATIAEWVDAGAPLGDRRKLPAPPTFAEGWQIGTPDVVIEMPEAFEVPAEGEIAYQYFAVPTSFDDETWVRGIEVRPGAPSVVHHILVYVRDPSGTQPSPDFKPIYAEDVDRERLREARARAEEGSGVRRENPGTLIGTMAPGTNPMVFEPGTALRLPKGAEIVFQVHYTSTGTAAVDRSRVGLTLATERPEREMRAGAFLNAFFEIPPGASNERVDSAIELTEDVEVFALFPHTHLRGKRWEYSVVYPDGRRDMVLSVPNYDFNWQTYYVFDEPLHLPKGTRIEASAWYDNSAANRANPDPAIPVRWGEQTWEEMQYSGITYSVSASSSDDTTTEQP